MKHMNTGLVLVVSLLAACSSGSTGDREPSNQAPTVSAIPATDTVANGTSQPIVFSVDDENVASLAITVTSDRPALVPDTAIVVDGSDTQRMLTITPAIDMTGDAMITVIAEDNGGLRTSSSFLLTVVAEQKSMAQFARDAFASAEDDEPVLINAVEFNQDADEDDFADLLDE